MPRLKQAAYQSRVAVDKNSRDSDTARQCRKFRGRIFADHLAVCGIYLLDNFVVRIRSHSKLIGFAGVIEVLVEQPDPGLHIRFGGNHIRGRRPRRGLAAWRQVTADVLNYNSCRRLTSVHEAYCRYLYRLSVASHAYTYLLNAYLSRFPTCSRNHGSILIGSSRGIYQPSFTLSAVTPKALRSAGAAGWPAPTPRCPPVPTPEPGSDSPFPPQSSHPEWCCAIASGSEPSRSDC
jgi:hypothetical protein